MLAYDWFMSDSLTQPGGQRRGAEHEGQGVTCTVEWSGCLGDGGQVSFNKN